MRNSLFLLSFLAASVLGLPTELEPTGTPHPGNSEWNPVGCWIDPANSRLLRSARNYDDTLTVDKCLTLCKDYKYAIVENKRECYCGDALSPAGGPAPKEECNMSCSGNVEEQCGGSMRGNLYERNYHTSTSSEYSSTSTMTPGTSSATSLSTPLGTPTCEIVTVTVSPLTITATQTAIMTTTVMADAETTTVTTISIATMTVTAIEKVTMTEVLSASVSTVTDTVTETTTLLIASSGTATEAATATDTAISLESSTTTVDSTTTGSTTTVDSTTTGSTTTVDSTTTIAESTTTSTTAAESLTSSSTTTDSTTAAESTSSLATITAESTTSTTSSSTTSSTSTAPVCTNTSPILNPSFELSSSWTPTTSGSTFVTGNQRSGTRALLFRLPRTAAATSTNTETQTLTVCPSTTYVLRAWTKMPLPSSACTLTFLIDGQAVAIAAAGASTGYTLTTASWTATGGTAVLTIRQVCTGTVPAGSSKDVYLDDVTLTLA